MKSKMLISLLLALLMLVTLATPVLAGKPAKGSMAKYPPETGSATYSLQATHDNYLKVTVVLRGAQPNTIYWLQLWWGNETPYSDGSSWEYQAVMTNARGSLRYSEKLDTVWSGTQYFQLQVLAHPYDSFTDTAYLSTVETFTFN